MSGIFDKVIEILVSLGINKTFFYQFAIFCLAYFGMSQIVFKPYLNAYKERKRRTVGGEEDAVFMTAEAEKTEAKYSQEAKDLNKKVKEIYKIKSDQAAKEKAQVIEDARQQAESQMKSGRDSLEATMDETRAMMKEHIPSISKKIEEKFSG